jgi:single-strand DNA-binding protein
MELTGRITADAQVKKTKDKRELVAFTIVVNDRYRTKDKEYTQVATFFNCAYWLSTKIAAHLKKGMIVTLFGRVDINSYKNREGEFFAHLIFHCNNIKIVASPKNMVAVGAEASDTVDDLPF